jgi:L-2-hydroxyglutarate oxidase
VDCELLTPKRFADIEPHARGEMALLVRDAGVVDYGAVCRSLAQRVIAHDGQILTGARVTALRVNADEVAIESTRGDFLAGHLVNCAGLHADRVARLAGERPGLRIIPFRGEYFRLAPDAEDLVRTMIYPVPDLRLPFLGPHLTRTIDGSVEMGPNAVLAFAREGYRFRALKPGDLASSLLAPGFLRFALGNLPVGLAEFRRSLSKGAFLRSIRRLVPEVDPKSVERAGSGVRAQALAPNGALLDEFAILEAERSTHVLNAPSPAATAALSIAEHIVSRIPAP